jgi:hypothetical protein
MRNTWISSALDSLDTLKGIFANKQVGPEEMMTKMVSIVLNMIAAEAVRRGEDPYSSASVVAARAAQADPIVSEAFKYITANLAYYGLALEGDGLGWRRRGLYDKGRRLVATKVFRPGDVIFEDSSCIAMRYDDEDIREHEGNGLNIVLQAFDLNFFI